jgi:hypothetical protein
MIFAWADDYAKKFYEIVGLVDILSGDYTDYYFDQLAKPHAAAWLLHSHLPAQILASSRT